MNYIPYNHLDYLQGDFSAYVIMEGTIPVKVRQLRFVRPLEAEGLIIIVGLIPDATSLERYTIGYWNKKGQPITNSGPYITHDLNYNLILAENEKNTN